MNPHAPLKDEAPITTFEAQIRHEFDEMTNLLRRKRLDYGPGNLTAFGLYGILVRMGDKVERLRNIYASGSTPETDSIEDSWRDILGYAALALRLMHTNTPELLEKATQAREIEAESSFRLLEEEKLKAEKHMADQLQRLRDSAKTFPRSEMADPPADPSKYALRWRDVEGSPDQVSVELTFEALPYLMAQLFSLPPSPPEFEPSEELRRSPDFRRGPYGF